MRVVFKRTMSVLLLLVLCSACARKDLTRVREEAYAAYEKSEYTTAAESFALLVEKSPEDVEFWFRLGNSYARIQNPQAAVNAYQNALLRDPTHVKAWYNMGVIQSQVALKTFVDMQGYVNKDHPLARQGESMREGLFLLLGNKNAAAEKN